MGLGDTSEDLERQDDAYKACGCMVWLGATFTTATLALLGFYDWLKSIVGALLTTFMFIPLMSFGLVPVLGQLAYRDWAPSLIRWVFATTQISPDIKLAVPDWVDAILSWVAYYISDYAGTHKIDGRIESYVYAVGYTESIGVSITIATIVLGRLLRPVFRSWAQLVALVVVVGFYLVAKLLLHWPV